MSSKGGAELLGLVDDRFDSILCLNVLEHIPDDAETLPDCLGRLEPGGHLRR